jgi:hypothetical protein
MQSQEDVVMPLDLSHDQDVDTDEEDIKHNVSTLFAELEEAI